MTGTNFTELLINNINQKASLQETLSEDFSQLYIQRHLCVISCASIALVIYCTC